MLLDHIEKYSASLSAAERKSPAVLAALDEIRRDTAARDRYLEFARDADEPAVRARMLELARDLGWLSPAERARGGHADVRRADRAGQGVGRRGEPRLRAQPGPQPGRRTAPAAAHAGADRQVRQRGAARMPGQRRWPRARAARADQRRATTTCEIAQIYLRHHPRRRGRDAADRDRHHADEGRRRAGARAQHAGQPAVLRSRGPARNWCASSRWPRPWTCSGRSPAC